MCFPKLQHNPNLLDLQKKKKKSSKQKAFALGVMADNSAMNIESSVFGQEPDDIDVMLMSMDNDEIKSTIIGANILFPDKFQQLTSFYITYSFRQ